MLGVRVEPALIVGVGIDVVPETAAGAILTLEKNAGVDIVVVPTTVVADIVEPVDIVGAGILTTPDTTVGVAVAPLDPTVCGTSTSYPYESPGKLVVATVVPVIAD